MQKPDPIQRLIEALCGLPGIGRKTATRLAIYISKSGREYPLQLAEAIRDVATRVKECSNCFNITDSDPCSICSSLSRNRDMICVVEGIDDLLSIEKSNSYKGLYHVLHGSISPLDDRGPDKLKISELVQRIKGSNVSEVIIATNPNVEGDATALYISKLLKPLGVKCTRLASGIPIGGELQYTDQLTIRRAFEGRTGV